MTVSHRVPVRPDAVATGSDICAPDDCVPRRAPLGATQSEDAVAWGRHDAIRRRSGELIGTQLVVAPLDMFEHDTEGCSEPLASGTPTEVPFAVRVPGALTSPARPALARASTAPSEVAHACRASDRARSPDRGGLVLEWPRRRKLVPRLRDIETGARARCRADGCPKLACYPDARCALHTAWLDGSAKERLAADAWTTGPPGHRRAQAWALWRVRMGLPSGDVFVPLLPEGT